VPREARGHVVQAHKNRAGAVGAPRSSRSEKTQTTVGRKVGFRIVMLAQRFEARPSVGDYTRDQFAPSVSFRVPADSLAMLHGDEAAAP
jgi:hypothetical protein